MFSRRQPSTSAQQLDAEDAIVQTLRGGDSLPAWNAIWDLVQSTDSHGKQEVLDALRDYVAAATAGGSDVESARQFARAIETSMSPPVVRRQVLPSKEVRDHHRRDQIEANWQAMQRIGVRPGEGLPMWSMYMTRRSKRSWS